eukprot:Tamp_04299.p1 GENE.Tamp_04299~~Tamp_04299.p1  ORF type:complete len:524 (+),score=98.60 Tamp_04299:26-1597(+)
MMPPRAALITAIAALAVTVQTAGTSVDSSDTYRLAARRWRKTGPGPALRIASLRERETARQQRASWTATLLRLGGGGDDEEERGDYGGEISGRGGNHSDVSALGADGHQDPWAAEDDGDDSQPTKLPASLQRAVEEALEEGTPCFPGAPASTRASLEAAAWKYLKQVRAGGRDKRGDDVEEDSDSLDLFDVDGADEDDVAEVKASVRAARRLQKDPAIAAYLDRAHLTQPPADYLDAMQHLNAGGGRAKMQRDEETGWKARTQWRGNWLGVGGHWTSLMHACRSGAIDVVNGILAHNASLASLAEPDSGFTALHWAAASAAVHLPPLPERDNAAVDEEMMHDRAEERAHTAERESTHVLCARALLGAMDASGENAVNARTADGRTAISFAVEACPCSLAMVKLLLAAGADVDAPDAQGRSPLHWAAMLGDDAAVVALLAAGAQVDRASGTGPAGPDTLLPLTPVAAAAMQGRVAVVRVLMKYGASTSFLDEPMFQALDFGARLDPAILKALGQEEEEESLFRG